MLLVRFVASARDLGPALQLLDQLSAEEMEATLFVVSSEEVSQHPIFSTTVSTINTYNTNSLTLPIARSWSSSCSPAAWAQTTWRSTR